MMDRDGYECTMTTSLVEGCPVKCTVQTKAPAGFHFRKTTDETLNNREGLESLAEMDTVYEEPVEDGADGDLSK